MLHNNNVALYAIKAVVTPTTATLTAGIDVVNTPTKLVTTFLITPIVTLNPANAALIVAIATCAAAATTLNEKASSLSAPANRSELAIEPICSITG